MLLAACNQAISSKPLEKTTLEGWQGLAFGTDFSTAVAHFPTIKWYAEDIEECNAKMATIGCSMYAAEGRLPPIDGIAFEPSLEFDKFGRLRQIDLSYEQRGEITRDQCIDLYVRSLDRLAKENGQFRSPLPNRQKEPGWINESGLSPLGNEFTLGTEVSSGAFVANPARSHWSGMNFPTTQPVTKWNRDPYVSLFSAFVGKKDDHVCHLIINYHGPERSAEQTTTVRNR